MEQITAPPLGVKVDATGIKHVFLPMYGFRFTTADVVFFECQITPCAGADCDVQVSDRDCDSSTGLGLANRTAILNVRTKATATTATAASISTTASSPLAISSQNLRQSTTTPSSTATSPNISQNQRSSSSSTVSSRDLRESSMSESRVTSSGIKLSTTLTTTSSSTATTETVRGSSSFIIKTTERIFRDRTTTISSPVKKGDAGRPSPLREADFSSKNEKERSGLKWFMILFPIVLVALLVVFCVYQLVAVIFQGACGLSEVPIGV